MWTNGQQPQTEGVEIEHKKNKVCLITSTKGASISYMILSKESKEKISNNSKWQLYTSPITIDKNSKLIAKASRIGFKESNVSELTIN